MLNKFLVIVILIFSGQKLNSQNSVQDTVYLMNGLTIGQKIIDTTFSTVTIDHPKKIGKKIHYEWNQLYMIRYANGKQRYYYSQDSSINNIFTRKEMWLFMKGENDARRGFKARGALITSGILGFLGGASGTIFGPLAPYGFMALSGVTKIRIKHKTISNPVFIESDAYILGYERVARQKRKTKSLLGGTIGLVVGYSFFAVFRSYYP